MTHRCCARTVGAMTTTFSNTTHSTILSRNRAFAATGVYEGVSVFPTLSMLVVGCLDPRVDPAQILGLELGDAMVVRNMGGRVTPDVIDTIAFVSELAGQAVPEGPLFEVAVIHHTECGARALADDRFRRTYAERIGADEAALRERAILDPAASVASDVGRLRAAGSLSPRVTVSGHVYDISTGLLRTIVPAAATAST